MRTSLIQASLLVVCLGTVGAIELPAQRPSPEGAWSACQLWVRRRLYEPPGLSFLALTQDAVNARETTASGRPRFVLRSFALLRGTNGQAEILPFSCTVDYGTFSLEVARAYVVDRLVLPDSTVWVPAMRARSSPNRD